MEGLGVEVLQSITHENKYFMAAGIVNRLKKLLNATTKHISGRKFVNLLIYCFGYKVYEFK